MFKLVSCVLPLSVLVIACSSQLVPDAPGRLGGSSVRGQALGLVDGSVIVDASVCVLDRRDLCTTTDADGQFELSTLPDHAELLISIDAPGYLRALRMLHTGEADARDLGPTTIPALDALSTQREALGIAATDRSGYVAFYSVTPGLLPVLSVRARLSPRLGNGPFYFNGNGEIDPELTTGTDASGYFYNVPPDDYALSVTTLGGTSSLFCDEEIEGLGWGLDSAGVGHRVRVVEDAMTFVVAQCPVEPASTL